MKEFLKFLESEADILELNEAVEAKLQALNEDKGNLKEIPDAWMKIVAKSYDAIGGRGSEIKEISAGTKNISKFRTSIIDAMKAEDLVAAFVTVNDGPFALLYKTESYSNSRPEFSIVAVNGEKASTQKSKVDNIRRRQKSEYSKKGYYTTYDRKTRWYEAESMPMSTLLPKLQGSIASVLASEDKSASDIVDDIFKIGKIDIYGITIDKERMATRKERSGNRPISGDSPDLLKKDLAVADKKFLKVKSNEVAKKLQDDVQAVISNIKEKISNVFDDAIEGKVSKINFDDELNSVKDKINEINKLARAIDRCVKNDGSVELVSRWHRSHGSVISKSYDFEELIKALASAKEVAEK